MNSHSPDTRKRQIEQRLEVAFPRANYLTHIDDRRRLVYVETPKVACTSIKKFMMDQYAGDSFPLENKSHVHNRTISPLKQISELTTEDALAVYGPDFQRFSFVRNPFSRLLSGYLDKLVTNEYERNRHLPMMGFEPGSHPTLLDFLERLAKMTDVSRDIHFTTQSALLMVNRVDYTFIGRFEGFRQDFLRMQNLLYGIKHSDQSYEDFGKHHASNANEKLAQYYGPREVDLVLEIYHADFDFFGYSKDLARSDTRESPVDLWTTSS